MNPILSNAGTARAVATPGATNMVVGKSANDIGAHGVPVLGGDSSSAQGETGFGDILGQLESLLADLAPATTQQLAPVNQPKPSLEPTDTAQSFPAGTCAPVSDVEGSLLAFMPATSVTHGKQSGDATDDDKLEGKSDAAVPVLPSLPVAFMPIAPMPAATFIRPAVGATGTSAGSVRVDVQDEGTVDALGAARQGNARAADIRAGAASTVTTMPAADAALSQSGDQTMQSGADGSGLGQLVAQLPGGNSPVVTDTVRLPNGDPSQWRQTLGEALGERIVLQREKGVDQASIRLDPPSMGQIEISIRHEGGILKVSIAATHTEVLNQLRGVGEALRQDLEQKHWGDVSVQVSQSGARLSGDDGRSGNGGREQSRRDPGRALADGDGDASAGFHLDEGEA